MNYKEKIVNYFQILKKHNRLSSSYLVVGDDLALIFDIIKLINCAYEERGCNKCDDCRKIERRVHPDVFLISPSSNENIKIEDIREAQNFLFLKSFQAKSKFLVINYAHKMTLESANAFLKTLEEAPPDSFIFLISSRLDLILPTIVSRCRRIYLPIKEEFTPLDRKEIWDFILNRKEPYIKERDYLDSFLLSLIMIMRDYIVSFFLSDINNLLIRDDGHKLKKINYPLSIAQKKLEVLLRIYNAIDNVNLNLATNILKLNF
ncbi:MAG: hypothetical protein NC820_01880 [Candidatus Omnitrophica bacterium]|nr:hypothetical protein [Candidatus Omnitrophota bacterium]